LAIQAVVLIAWRQTLHCCAAGVTAGVCQKRQDSQQMLLPTTEPSGVWEDLAHNMMYACKLNGVSAQRLGDAAASECWMLQPWRTRWPCWSLVVHGSDHHFISACIQ
jgi:hypothetical protein